jgi:hypothetical protein
LPTPLSARAAIPEPADAEHVRALDRVAVALKKPALRVLGIHPFHDANVRAHLCLANGADIPTDLAPLSIK